MLKIGGNITLIIVSTLLLGGCSSFDERYTWESNNGDIFELLVRVDEENQLVSVIDKRIIKNFSDEDRLALSSRFMFDEKESALFLSSDNQACVIVSKRNWDCKFPSVDRAIMRQLTMAEGRLLYKYGSENRVYKRSYRLVW